MESAIQKMLVDMQLRGMSPGTQQCYSIYVRIFQKFYEKSTAELGGVLEKISISAYNVLVLIFATKLFILRYSYDEITISFMKEMIEMKIRFLPKSYSGKWAAGLNILSY